MPLVLTVVDGLVVVPPLFGGYLIPLDGQDPAFGALIGTKVPSIMDPFKLKYQLIWFNAPDVQSSAGTKPYQKGNDQHDVWVSTLVYKSTECTCTHPGLFGQSRS